MKENYEEENNEINTNSNQNQNKNNNMSLKANFLTSTINEKSIIND